MHVRVGRDAPAVAANIGLAYAVGWPVDVSLTLHITGDACSATVPAALPVLLFPLFQLLTAILNHPVWTGCAPYTIILCGYLFAACSPSLLTTNLSLRFPAYQVLFTICD